MTKAYGFRKRISYFLSKGYSTLKIIRTIKRLYPSVKKWDIYRIIKTMRSCHDRKVFKKNFSFRKRAGKNPCKGKKLYYITSNVGKAKYVISFHNGIKKHKDGSDFYDIKIFNNKKRLNEFVEVLVKNGYIYRSAFANPAGFLPNKMVKIYDRCLAIVAVKGAGSNFPREKFIHRFHKKAGVYGLPNGNILIKPE